MGQGGADAKQHRNNLLQYCEPLSTERMAECIQGFYNYMHPLMSILECAASGQLVEGTPVTEMSLDSLSGPCLTDKQLHSHLLHDANIHTAYSIFESKNAQGQTTAAYFLHHDQIKQTALPTEALLKVCAPSKQERRFTCTVKMENKQKSDPQKRCANHP